MKHEHWTCDICSEKIEEPEEFHKLHLESAENIDVHQRFGHGSSERIPALRVHKQITKRFDEKYNVRVQYMVPKGEKYIEASFTFTQPQDLCHGCVISVLQAIGDIVNGPVPLKEPLRDM